MKSFEAETLILAEASTVWSIITDAGNYPVWDSGIAEVIGQVGHGERIRIRTHDSDKRVFDLRVSQIPGQVMTWSGGLPLGLLQYERTFTLTDYTGITHLHVRASTSGPLRGLARKTMSDSHLSLARYVDAVKFRAELLSFHLEGGVFPLVSIPRQRTISPSHERWAGSPSNLTGRTLQSRKDTRPWSTALQTDLPEQLDLRGT